MKNDLIQKLERLFASASRFGPSQGSRSIGSTPVFEFPEDRYWIGGPTLVAVVPADVVNTRFSERDLLKTFGSFVAYVDESSGRSFLGVVQPARIRHFYRALGARGVSTTVSQERPPELRLLGRSGV